MCVSVIEHVYKYIRRRSLDVMALRMGGVRNSAGVTMCVCVCVCVGIRSDAGVIPCVYICLCVC